MQHENLKKRLLTPCLSDAGSIGVLKVDPSQLSFLDDRRGERGINYCSGAGPSFNKAWLLERPRQTITPQATAPKLT